MRVPPGLEELYEPDALLDQSPGQEAPPAEALRRRVIQPVRFSSFPSFLREIEEPGHLGLHAEDQLVRGHARRGVRVAGVPLAVFRVELPEQVEVGALRIAVHPGWGLEV